MPSPLWRAVLKGGIRSCLPLWMQPNIPRVKGYPLLLKRNHLRQISLIPVTLFFLKCHVNLLDVKQTLLPPTALFFYHQYCMVVLNVPILQPSALQTHPTLQVVDAFESTTISSYNIHHPFVRAMHQTSLFPWLLWPALPFWGDGGIGTVASLTMCNSSDWGGLWAQSIHF